MHLNSILSKCGGFFLILCKNDLVSSTFGQTDLKNRILDILRKRYPENYPKSNLDLLNVGCPARSLISSYSPPIALLRRISWIAPIRPRSIWHRRRAAEPDRTCTQKFSTNISSTRKGIGCSRKGFSEIQAETCER